MRFGLALVLALVLAGGHLIFPFSVEHVDDAGPGEQGALPDGPVVDHPRSDLPLGDVARSDVVADLLSPDAPLDAAPGDAAPGDMDTGVSCTSDAACAKGQACDVHGCADGATGSCVIKQMSCPGTVAEHEPNPDPRAENGWRATN